MSSYWYNTTCKHTYCPITTTHGYPIFYIHATSSTQMSRLSYTARNESMACAKEAKSYRRHLFVLVLRQDFDGVFAEHVAQTTPNCCGCDGVSIAWSVSNARRSIDAQYQYEELCNRCTYCKAARPTLASKATRGFIIVTPIRPSCRNVLYLLMVVGRTSADGREKSQ